MHSGSQMYLQEKAVSFKRFVAIPSLNKYSMLKSFKCF